MGLAGTLLPVAPAVRQVSHVSPRPGPGSRQAHTSRLQSRRLLCGEGRSDETEGVGRLPQAGSLHRKLHQLSIVPCVLTFFSDALVQAKNAAARAGTPGRAGRLGPQAAFAAGVLGLRGQLTLPPAPPPASPSCALSPHPLTLAVRLSRTLAFTCLHPSCPEYGCGPIAKDPKPVARILGVGGWESEVQAATGARFL